MKSATRRVLNQAARALLEESLAKGIKPEELAGFTECFVVGTAAEVTPVGQIGEYSFTPGALSLGLADDYARMVRRQLTPA